jgi:hypothetical protein
MYDIRHQTCPNDEFRHSARGSFRPVDISTTIGDNQPGLKADGRQLSAISHQPPVWDGMRQGHKIHPVNPVCF